MNTFLGGEILFYSILFLKEAVKISGKYNVSKYASFFYQKN